MTIHLTLNEGRVPVRIWTPNVEHEALRQLINLSQLSIILHPIAAMPDVHMGRGATVGSVIPTATAIIPAAVGVDIGCGMCAVRLTLNTRDLPDNLHGVRNAIEAAVPTGSTPSSASIPSS
jgi:tRNA-splicing ligase RtcB